tara:strand:+ start:77 stop:718 length:642 start_codon:yes stop_codon:yes gene_type:complete
MPLPTSGEIKVSQINTELSRASNTANSNFAGGTTPQTGSLFKLGEAGGVNQTAPHAMSEFYGYGLSPFFSHISGAINIGSQDGYEDLACDTGGVFNDQPITFQDKTYGDGNEADSIWQIDVPSNYMSSPGYGSISATLISGLIDDFRLYYSANSTGPWTLASSGFSTYRNFSYNTGNSSSINYVRIQIGKDGGDEDTLYTANIELVYSFNECV